MDRRRTALEERTEAEYAHRTIKPGGWDAMGKNEMKRRGGDERTKSRGLRAKDGGKNGSQRDRTIDARPRTHVDGARLKILDE